jgi:hypothetical protein
MYGCGFAYMWVVILIRILSGAGYGVFSDAVQSVIHGLLQVISAGSQDGFSPAALAGA